MNGQMQIRLLIYALLLTTFFAGVPVFHYVAAVMIGLLIHYRDDPRGLLAPVRLRAAG